MWLTFIKCTDESSSGNQVERTRPLVLINCSYLFRLPWMESSGPYVTPSVRSPSPPFKRFASQFIGCNTRLILSDVWLFQRSLSKQRVCCCDSQIIKAFILTYLLKHGHLDVRGDSLIVRALLRCLSLSLHSDIRLIWRRLFGKKICFSQTKAPLHILLHTRVPCSFFFLPTGYSEYE